MGDWSKTADQILGPGEIRGLFFMPQKVRKYKLYALTAAIIVLPYFSLTQTFFCSKQVKPCCEIHTVTS